MSTWESWMGASVPVPAKAAEPTAVNEDALARMADRLFDASMSSTKWRTVALRLVTKFRERERVWRLRGAEAQTEVQTLRTELNTTREKLRQARKDYADLQAKKNPPKKAPPKRKPIGEVFDDILKGKKEKT